MEIMKSKRFASHICLACYSRVTGDSRKTYPPTQKLMFETILDVSDKLVLRFPCPEIVSVKTFAEKCYNAETSRPEDGQSGSHSFL